MRTPVLIIAYSRHVNVVRLIENLYRQGVERIYIAIDGSRNSNTELQSKIEMSALSLSNQLSLEIIIWRRDENLGPAVSVITAIDWFFKHENEGIILEDDLFLSSDAVQFFESSLACFSAVENVFMIAGSNYFESATSKLAAPATRYPVIWGWATWAVRWHDYRSALNGLEQVHVPGTITERWFWEIGVRRCLNGIKDAWDIPLATYQLSVRKLTVLPPVNLVSNHGADIFAGNTHIDEWPLNIPVDKLAPEMNESRAKTFSTVGGKSVMEIDELFRNRIYKIRTFRILPSPLSRFLDFLRYPPSTRNEPLVQRISQVRIPT